MEFVIAFIFMSVCAILTIMAKLSEKVKSIVKDTIQRCISNYDNEPMYYAIIDTYIPKTKEIDVRKIPCPIDITNLESIKYQTKYICLGTPRNLILALTSRFGSSNSFNIQEFSYVDYLSYTENYKKFIELINLKETLISNAENIKNIVRRRKEQKRIKNMSKSELIAKKIEIDKELNFYNDVINIKWNNLVGNNKTYHYIQKNLSNTKLDTKRKNIAINNSTKEQHCKDNYEENQQEKYYCERCFKEISYEEYELYDFMCEDCFEEVDLDIYKRKK